MFRRLLEGGTHTEVGSYTLEERSPQCCSVPTAMDLMLYCLSLPPECLQN